MSKSQASFSRKDRVEHSVYGTGTIEEVNERYTTIAFDEAGSKKFLTRAVALVRSDVIAPTKPVRRKKKVAARS